MGDSRKEESESREVLYTWAVATTLEIYRHVGDQGWGAFPGRLIMPIYRTGLRDQVRGVFRSSQLRDSREYGPIKRHVREPGSHLFAQVNISTF